MVGLTLFIFGTEPWMLIVGTVLWGIGCSLGFPVGMSAAADVPDRRLAAARVSAVAIIGYCAFLAARRSSASSASTSASSTRCS